MSETVKKGSIYGIYSRSTYIQVVLDVRWCERSHLGRWVLKIAAVSFRRLPNDARPFKWWVANQGAGPRWGSVEYRISIDFENDQIWSYDDTRWHDAIWICYVMICSCMMLLHDMFLSDYTKPCFLVVDRARKWIVLGAVQLRHQHLPCSWAAHQWLAKFKMSMQSLDDKSSWLMTHCLTWADSFYE